MFIYSKKATKFCKIFTLSCVVSVKSKVKISQNVVAFSEWMNFNKTQMFLSFQLDVSKNLGKYPIMVVVGEI